MSIILFWSICSLLSLAIQAKMEHYVSLKDLAVCTLFAPVVLGVQVLFIFTLKSQDIYIWEKHKHS